GHAPSTFDSSVTTSAARSPTEHSRAQASRGREMRKRSSTSRTSSTPSSPIARSIGRPRTRPAHCLPQPPPPAPRKQKAPQQLTSLQGLALAYPGGLEPPTS